MQENQEEDRFLDYIYGKAIHEHYLFDDHDLYKDRKFFVDKLNNNLVVLSLEHGKRLC
jgi:hypothetical protein